MIDEVLIDRFLLFAERLKRRRFFLTVSKFAERRYPDYLTTLERLLGSVAPSLTVGYRPGDVCLRLIFAYLVALGEKGWSLPPALRSDGMLERLAGPWFNAQRPDDIDGSGYWELTQERLTANQPALAKLFEAIASLIDEEPEFVDRDRDLCRFAIAFFFSFIHASRMDVEQEIERVSPPTDNEG